MTVLHELTHAMVFHNGLFETYIDANMNVREWGSVSSYDPMNGQHGRVEGDTPINGYYRSWPYYIITPKVLEVARNHFDCQNMTGVPLERTSVWG